jgi:exodeoxyribonuclease VII large subunit
MPQHIFSISELTSRIKETLEVGFNNIWVEGEISTLRTPISGHQYFILKDKSAQCKAVIFKNVSKNIKFKLEELTQVLAFGSIDVYAKRGDYQLIITKIEPKGVGALQLAFLQLKEKLEKEGLFDPKYKKDIPESPQKIGIITSPTGAAIKDILNVIERRFSNIHILIYPVKVQGKEAAGEIAEGIQVFNKTKKVDVLIIGRGGGSIEDLWAFNEEIVARAIFESQIPIISAVGHEIDYVISDFVADLRAPTPSAAAEMVVKDQKEVINKITHLENTLYLQIKNYIDNQKNKLELLDSSYVFKQLSDRINNYHQILDEYIDKIDSRLSLIIEKCKSAFGQLTGRLNSLSPLAILSRGYSVTFKLPEKTIIKNASQLKQGDKLEHKLNKGKVISLVEKIISENKS